MCYNRSSTISYSNSNKLIIIMISRLFILDKLFQLQFHDCINKILSYKIIIRYHYKIQNKLKFISSCKCLKHNYSLLSRASVEKFPGVRGQRKKQDRKNSTIKSPSTLSVSCTKIQGPCPLLQTPMLASYFPLVVTNIRVRRCIMQQTLMTI